MYAGEVVELADVNTLFARSTHPYTEALLRAMPRADRDSAALEPIPSSVPSLAAIPHGCAYASRCPYWVPSCDTARPALMEAGYSGHRVRCPVRIDGGALA
jgi:oligopeptide/dipeptide ABC transporter ATP-binding protein